MQNFIVVLRRSPLLPSTDDSRMEVGFTILNIMPSRKLVMKRVGLQSNKQTREVLANTLVTEKTMLQLEGESLLFLE